MFFSTFFLMIINYRYVCDYYIRITPRRDAIEFILLGCSMAIVLSKRISEKPTPSL